MKKILTILLGSFLAFGLTGCFNNSGLSKTELKKGTPEYTLVRFYESLKNGDEKAIKELATPLLYKSAVVMSKEDCKDTTSKCIQKAFAADYKEIEVVLSRDDGRKAVVKVKITNMNGEVSNERESLIKEDGAWKVSLF